MQIFIARYDEYVHIDIPWYINQLCNYFNILVSFKLFLQKYDNNISKNEKCFFIGLD